MKTIKDLTELLITALAIVILFGIVLTGCGDANVDQPVRDAITGEPELIQHVETFKQEMIKYEIIPVAINLHLEFGETGRDGKDVHIATCNESKGTITVNKEYFDYLSESDREAIMFHELGHCVLHREHDNSWDAINSRPTTIMGANFKMGIYYNYRDYYVRELLGVTE